MGIGEGRRRRGGKTSGSGGGMVKRGRRGGWGGGGPGFAGASLGWIFLREGGGGCQGPLRHSRKTRGSLREVGDSEEGGGWDG